MLQTWWQRRGVIYLASTRLGQDLTGDHGGRWVSGDMGECSGIP